jgi:hypothetical protein
MRKFHLILGIAFFLFSAASCIKDKDPAPNTNTESTVTIKVNLLLDGMPYTFKNPIALGGNNRHIFDVFMFYMNAPSMIKSDGTLQPIADVFLVDLDPNINTNSPKRDKNRIGTSFNYKIPVGSYKGIAFGLGSDSKVNGEKNPANYKPTSYAIGHPYAYSGMDWDIWKMYRHIRIEGAIDTTKNQTGDYKLPITWHTGFDSLYRDVKLMKDMSITTTNYDININVEIKDLIQQKTNGIKIPVENYTEMNNNPADGILGVKITENLIKAMSVK